MMERKMEVEVSLSSWIYSVSDVVLYDAKTIHRIFGHDGRWPNWLVEPGHSRCCLVSTDKLITGWNNVIISARW